MRKSPVDHDGIHMEVVLVDVCACDAYAYMVHAERFSARFGELDAVYRNGSLDIRGENIVQVARKVHVDRERTLEILVVDKVVQIGLSAGEREILERNIQVEIVSCRVRFHFHVQVSAVGELEAESYIGLLVAQVNGGNIEREILQMDFRTDFRILIDDVALLEHDIFDRDVEGEAFCDFCRIYHSRRISGDAIGRHGNGIGRRRIALG